MSQQIVLDLTKAAWRHQHGDLSVIGSWWFGETGPRPCLVIVPSNATDYQRTTPCVVHIDQAWVWSEQLGDPKRAAQTATIFANALGMPNELQSVLRIASIIRDHIGDLLAIKPYEAYSNDFVSVADATLTDHSTGKVTEAEIGERL